MKKIALFMSLAFLIVPLYGSNWTNFQLQVISETNVNSTVQTMLQDADGKLFRVISAQDVSDTNIQRIVTWKNLIGSWTNVSIKTIDFTVAVNEIDMVIIPESLMYNDTNIVSSLPAGMLFLDTGVLYYDFRMKKDNLFLRINGKYKDQEDLFKKIIFAYQDPNAYLRATEPEARLEVLEERVSYLESMILAMMTRGYYEGMVPMSEVVVNKVSSLKKENPKWGKKEIMEALRKEKSKITEKEVSTILLFYFKE